MLGATVTLTDADTNYKLSDLLPATWPKTGRELYLESDKENGVALIRGGGTNPDGTAGTDLSDTNCGFKLLSAESKVYRAEGNTVGTDDKYLRSDTAGAKVNVELEVF